MCLSAGRAWLGIGAGYNGDEARAMGLFLLDTAERFVRMTDLLRLARQMWRGDESPFRVSIWSSSITVSCQRVPQRHLRY